MTNKTVPHATSRSDSSTVPKISLFKIKPLRIKYFRFNSAINRMDLE